MTIETIKAEFLNIVNEGDKAAIRKAILELIELCKKEPGLSYETVITELWLKELYDKGDEKSIREGIKKFSTFCDGYGINFVKETTRLLTKVDLELVEDFDKALKLQSEGQFNIGDKNALDKKIEQLRTICNAGGINFDRHLDNLFDKHPEVKNYINNRVSAELKIVGSKLKEGFKTDSQLKETLVQFKKICDDNYLPSNQTHQKLKEFFEENSKDLDFAKFDDHIDKLTSAELKAAEWRLIQSFNSGEKGVKDAIKQFKEICDNNMIPHDKRDQKLATFFWENNKDLDLIALGEYLGAADNKGVLTSFVSNINIGGQTFAENLKSFLNSFKLPGESQKVDRLMEAFGQVYKSKDVANSDAAYKLAFQTIMLQTDYNSVSLKGKKHMDLKDLQRNLKGQNDGKDFTRDFLEKEVFNEIVGKPITVKFIKVNPGYELSSKDLKKDPAFNKLKLLFRSPELGVNQLFKGLDENIVAEKSKEKGKENIIVLYEVSKDKENNTIKVPLATIEAENLNSIFKKPKITIRTHDESGKATLNQVTAVATIAANFQTSAIPVVTYNYEKDQFKYALDIQKINLSPDPERRISFSSLKEGLKAHKKEGLEVEQRQSLSGTPKVELMEEEDLEPVGRPRS